MAGSQQRDDDLRMSSDSNVRETFLFRLSYRTQRAALKEVAKVFCRLKTI